MLFRSLSFLPQYVVENSPYRDRLQILQVKDFHMHMYRQLFYHKDKWLTQAMKVFLRLALRENPQDKRERTPRIFPGIGRRTLARTRGV